MCENNNITLHITDVADTILPILGCLKDSCTVTDTLLTSFKESGGYVLLTEAIINVINRVYF